MYKCSNEDCSFETESIVSETGQYLMCKDLCRSCYYRRWKEAETTSTFNTTASEEMYYSTIGYDLNKAQDYLCGRL